MNQHKVDAKCALRTAQTELVLAGRKDLADKIERIRSSMNTKQAKDGAYMAKSQLKKVAEYSAKLYDMIPEGYDLEDWMRTKISQMADDVGEVYHALDHRVEVASELMKMARVLTAKLKIRPSFKGKRLEGAITSSMIAEMNRDTHGKILWMLRNSQASNVKVLENVSRNLEKAFKQSESKVDFSYIGALHTAYINLDGVDNEISAFAKKKYNSWLGVIQGYGRDEYIYSVEHKLSGMLNSKMPRTVDWKRLNFNTRASGTAAYLLEDINGDEKMLVEVTGIGVLSKGGMEISVVRSEIGDDRAIWTARNMKDATKIFQQISEKVA
jgi:hypothetical protein